MPISFNLIPNLLLTPGAYVEYDASRAVTGLAILPNVVLLIGNRLSTGSVAAETPVQVTRPSDGQAFFGEGSQLGRMVETFKRQSQFTEVWAIALDDDGAGVAATKTITVTGTATSTGNLILWIHGVRVPVLVTEGDDPTAIATAIAAAINATANLMFTASSAVGVVTLTCRHAAAFGEDLDVRENYSISSAEREALPGAVTLAIADGTTGAGNPDVTLATAAAAGTWYTKWVSGYSDATNVAALEAALDAMWGPTVQQDAVMYAGKAGTFSDLTTYGGTRNSQFSSIMHVGGVVAGSPTPEFEMAALVAAADSNEPDPARPRQTLELKGALAPERQDLFDQGERNLLLQNGISTFTADQSGKVYIERLITTYQENAAAQPDTTYLNVNTMHTLAALRYTLRFRITSKYPRHKLVNDGTDYGSGQAVVTPQIIRAEIISLFGEWESNVWVEDFEQFADELIVERNASDRDRLDARLGPNLANQFRVFAGQLQFII